MKTIKLVIFLLLSISIIGCSTTGGTIGGLFPAPKFTKGKINNDIYTSKDKDFSVSIPHKKGTREFTYLQIKEQYRNTGAYINFGPAALDQSIYRLEIGKKLTPENKNNFVLSDAVDAVIESYSKQLEVTYKSKPELVKKEKILINGFESYAVNLTQNAPNQTLTHEIIVTDYPTMAVIFWVQESSANSFGASINALEFAQSFKVL